MAKHKARAVIDTSVLVAGVSGFRQGRKGFQNNANAELIKRWISYGSFTWLYSADIVAEYKHILAKKGVRPNTIGKIINLLRDEGSEVLVSHSHEISPDYTDNPFCDCAIEGEADYVVTNNLRDFPQGNMNSTVISPNLFQFGTLHGPANDQIIRLFWGTLRKFR